MADPKSEAENWLMRKTQGYMEARPGLQADAKKLTDGYGKVQRSVDGWAKERANNGPPRAMADAEGWLNKKLAPVGQMADSAPPEPFQMPMQGDQSAHPDEVRGMRDTRPIDRPAPQPKVDPDSLMAQAQVMLAEHKAKAEAAATQEEGQPSIGDRDDAGDLLPAWLKGAAGR